MESDDVVIFGSKEGGHKVAIVTSTYDSEDENNDDDSEDCPLKPGEANITVYPYINDTKTTLHKTVVVDRHLNMGEMVVRGLCKSRVGCVVESCVLADLLVLPEYAEIVRGVDVSTLQFVTRFDPDAINSNVLLDNWAGYVQSITHKYLVRCPPYPFKAWIKSTHITDGRVRDVTARKIFRKVVPAEQLYPNQVISVPYEVLSNAEWVEGFCPPSKKSGLFSKTKNVECVVETLTIDNMNVLWKAPIVGDGSDKPDNLVTGEAVNRVRKLDHFSHVTVSVGDRFVARLEDHHVANMVPYSQWSKIVTTTYNQLKQNVIGAGAVVKETSAVDSDEETAYYTASETSNDNLTSEKVSSKPLVQPSSTASPSPPARFNVKTGRQPKRNKRAAKPRVKSKPKNRGSSASVKAGQVYIGEVVMTETRVSVMWEDGVVEKNIPSRELTFLEEDMDQCQHTLVPGCIVKPKEANSTWPTLGYAMVQKVDGGNRVASVVIVDLSDPTSPMLRDALWMSLLDLVDHQDYNLHTGDVVLRIGQRTSLDPCDNIGQVFPVLHFQTGKIRIKWLNGLTSSEFASDVTTVFAYADEDSVNGDNDSEWETDSEMDKAYEVCVDVVREACEMAEQQTMDIDDDEQINNNNNNDNPHVKDEPMHVDSPANGSIRFTVEEKAPGNHNYIDKLATGIFPRIMMKAVRYEHKLLANSLPENVFIKAFEDRLDLFSCMLIGPEETPFSGGLFFFDVQLPQNYPNAPPMVFYKSFCCEQLNPNLYVDGTVCLSLLGTWSGMTDSENWNPGSNLMQVFVSISGLVLNSEPYYNEAGYETRKDNLDTVPKSKRYNETALVRTIQSLTRVIREPHAPFVQEVQQYWSREGPSLVHYYSTLLDGNAQPQFPLAPVSQGCVLTATPHLMCLRSLLAPNVS